MKAPVGWLKDFTPVEVSIKEFCDRMTLSGSKVEGVDKPGDAILRVVVGRILSIRPHPDADRLSICSVDVGGDRPLDIVTGASNIAEGQTVPVALDGAVLPDGTRISTGRLRGQLSEGMLCSMQELGLAPEDLPGADPDGILILTDHPLIGARIPAVLGLDETIVDFEITSNRPDCFCMEGLGREAAVTMGTPFLPMNPAPSGCIGQTSASCAAVCIEAPDLCFRYVGRVVNNVRVGPSPEWMRRRLRHAGMRPVNNVVDITNYVMLEIGQPMHAFDLDRIAGGRITVRRARREEVLRTLDGVERALDQDMAVIADDDGVVAVAGVMGGENSEIQADTTTLLLEAACFEPVHVRLAAKRLGMRTEASARFEKGLDPENCMRAIDRACDLMMQIGCGEPAQDAIEDWPTHLQAIRIPFRPDRFNALLGTGILAVEMRDILKAIGCGMDMDPAGEESVVPPSWRPDLRCDADLAEEIARFHGYSLIPATLLSGKETTLGGRSGRQRLQEILKDVMISQGFYECCTYSFESPRVLDSIRLPEQDSLRNAVMIRNPLGEEYGMMRTSMLPSMLRVAALNWSRQAPEMQVFEIAFTYHPVQSPIATLPDERRILSACAFARDDNGEKLFLRMKGTIEDMAARMGAEPPAFSVSGMRTPPYLHPGKTAELTFHGVHEGWAGYLHPAVAKSFGVPENSVYLELALDPFLDRAGRRKALRPLPRFPSVSRDLAVLVARVVSVGDLVGAITENGGEYLEDARLFDVYLGKQVAEDCKSAAFTLVFRAPDRTLTDDEVAAAMRNILAALETNFQARLR